ncbi:MAG: hypothetical protein R3Y63_12710 [Eubacteriales bacterium]
MKVKLFYGLVFLFLLVGCRIEVIDPTPLPEEPVTFHEDVEIPTKIPSVFMTLDSVEFWLNMDLNALYRLEYNQEYLEYFTFTPEKVELRQQTLFLQDLTPLFQSLWAEYPSEENYLLGQRVLTKYYQEMSFVIEEIVFQEETGDFLLDISFQSLVLPEHFTKEYYQENFDLLVEGENLSKISLETYEMYDQQGTENLLNELLYLEEIPRGETRQKTITLKLENQAYVFTDWESFHEEMFPFA